MKECSKCKKIKDIKEFYSRGNQCKECQIERQKLYINKNSQKSKQKRLEYYHNNSEKLNFYHKNYVEKTKEQRNTYWRKYQKDKWDNDSLYKSKKLLRKQIYNYLNGRKNNITENLLEYNYNIFLETLGPPPLNYHLDHKIPISWFKEKTPISIIWNLENLHYIKSDINFSKKNYFAHPITEEYKNSIKIYIKTKYQSKL